MRDFVTLECTACKTQYYRTEKELRGGERLEIRKHCRRCNKHTLHRQRKK